MSDLNELKPLVVDDIIVEAAAGKFESMTSRDVQIMMNEKVHNVFDNKKILEIEYSLDELVLGQDYWVNTLLDRPVRGLNGYDPRVASEEEFKVDVVEPISSGPEGYKPAAIDVTDSIVKPSSGKIEESAGGLGVTGFFTIMIILSIIFYVIRKFKEIAQLSRHDKSDGFTNASANLL